MSSVHEQLLLKFKDSKGHRNNNDAVNVVITTVCTYNNLCDENRMNGSENTRLCETKKVTYFNPNHGLF